MNEELAAAPRETLYESEELDKLYMALSKAQGEMGVAKNESKNPFHKSTYANLQSVIKASRPALTKNGLAVIQRPTVKAGESYLLTRLVHSSGQWIESIIPIKPIKSDIQSFGSYLTYLKRYSYSALVGVISEDLEDDDGEKTMQRVPVSTIDREQLEELSKTLEGQDSLLEEILKGLKIKKLSDIPSKHFARVSAHVRKVQQKQEEGIDE